jgi:hypothetical protein
VVEGVEGMLTLGSKSELGKATTQRIKLTLAAGEPGQGEDTRIADTGRESAGPP